MGALLPIAAALSLLAATAAPAAPTRWVMAPNPDSQFPGTSIVTGYGESLGGVPGAMFNPGAKMLLVTTACARGGGMGFAGGIVVENGCRTFVPGLIAPRNEPVLCMAIDCAFSAILK